MPAEALARLAAAVGPVTGPILEVVVDGACPSIAALAWTGSPITTVIDADAMADPRGRGRESGYELALIGPGGRSARSDRMVTLVKRATTHLVPGGRLVLLDRTADDRPAVSTQLRWLVDAGLVEATALDLGTDRHRAVLARLPASWAATERSER